MRRAALSYMCGWTGWDRAAREVTPCLRGVLYLVLYLVQ